MAKKRKKATVNPPPSPVPENKIQKDNNDAHADLAAHVIEQRGVYFDSEDMG